MFEKAKLKEPILRRSIMICVGLLCSFGCNRSNPYLTTQPAAIVPSAPSNAGSLLPGWFSGTAANPIGPSFNQQASIRESDLSRRLQMLDENNRQLQTQLAQSQQQAQLAADERALLRRQLQDAAQQLQNSKIASDQASQQLRGLSQQYQGLQESTQLRGGARLTANSSLRGRTESLSQLGFPVFQEADIIRMRIPADQLFQPNSATLTPSASDILDRTSEILRREFSRQRVGIEGHTDAGPFYGGNFSTAQQLASAQSTAIVEHLQRRNKMPSAQLFSLAHGTNHSIADNATPTGRAQNRRIEIVVYPDSF